MRGWKTRKTHDIVKYADLNDVGIGGTFHISYDVMSVIRKLCTEIKLEWQMLLIGEYDLEGNVVITDYYIPKQEITGASVENLDCITQEFVTEKGIIATIHSHANMNTFFSATDVKDTNSSFIKHHIVVNNKLDFSAVTQWALPNGSIFFFKANVTTSYPQATEVKGIENITERAYVPPAKAIEDYNIYNAGRHMAKPNNNGVNSRGKRKHALTHYSDDVFGGAYGD